MVNVGSTGSLGAEWAVKDARRNKLASMYGQDVSFVEAVDAFGIDLNEQVDAIVADINFAQQDDLDLQFDKLEYDEYVFSKDNLTIQSKDGKVYTNLDFKGGTYDVASEKQFAASVGIEYKNDKDKPYDYIKFGNNTIQFTDLVFAGAGDGKNDRISLDLSKVQDIKWNNVFMNIQEVNVNENDVNSIIDTVPEYILEQIKAELADYKEGTPEYNEKFLEVAGKLMDQEDYMNKKEISAPGDTKLAQSSKAFDVKRDENGRVRIVLNTEEDAEVEVKGAGVISGSAMISLGITNKDSNESVVQIGNKAADKDLNFKASDRVVNFETFGQNVKADFNSQVAEMYNINWQADNGSFDSSETNATILMERGGKNNIFNYSDYNPTYEMIDANSKNNTAKGKGVIVKD